MPDHSELAAFLRAHREQLRPADVGLRDSGRRRTPGLRREEVATLAGVSVDYLMRLEQGRDVKPSASVIAALATALQLTEAERMHLAKLAAINSASEMCPAATPLVAEIAPTVRLILDRLDPTPAFVIGPMSDVLGWNRSWQALAEPLGLLETSPPNLAHYVFQHAHARVAFLDWSQAADEQANRLRAASLRWGDDEHFGALLASLDGHPEFASRWAAHSVAAKNRGITRIAHPDVGELRMAFEVLELPADGEQQLITWFAADEASEAALRRAIDGSLPVSPAQLRVVREA